MKAVILAGGFGTRLGEETELVPKPMVMIGDKPILWHIMKTYSHYGIHDFIICLGYKSHVVKDFFANYAIHTSDVTFELNNGKATFHQRQAEPWRVTLVDTGPNSMTGGRLKRVKDYVGHETFCFTYGDGVSDIPVDKLVAFHHAHGKWATVTAVTPPGRFGVMKMNGNQVEGFSEKVDIQESLINAGYFVLEPDVFDIIAGDSTSWEQEPLQKLASWGKLMAYRHTGFWQCMDNPREKRELEKLWVSGNAPWKCWP
jgi:glucose-1-phosphate cytidylyltransferase